MVEPQESFEPNENSSIDKQVNLMDQFIADGGFEQAFKDVFGLSESVKQSLKEIS
ncbi:hypothetical protein F906_01551 [Acinetobacter pseudolwoffii]|uniref:Uncharacterized protein n=1 Tax=Acinetobacter pseudolwoffii TaxID=2053287 RepID=N9M762_9GAMM|nr:hypothetical protein [Acinetobacter pseudolwoffii]ENW86496.1 hypothetical protein F906_01551 [Acinetobacter pseudolwoffii]